MVVFEQPGSDQPYGGRILLGVSECAAGAVLPRRGERAVQHRGGGEGERLAVVPQAAGDLPSVQKPWPRAELVAVMSEVDEDLAGAPEARFELFYRLDSPGERPAETAGELLCGARFPDAGEHRLDGAAVSGAIPVEVVDRAASGIPGAICVSMVDREVDALDVVSA